MDGNDGGNAGKCPVMHGGPKHASAAARSNRDWWPNQLNLEILHQNSPRSNPLGEVFNYVVTIENIPDTLKVLLSGWDLSPLGFLLLVNLILLVLGCLLEGTAILLIVVPVLIPTAKALGIDMVHFGVVVVVNIMLGLITPPYGLLLFIMNNITGVPLREIVRECMPFLAAMIAALAVITLSPGLVLWLPRLMGYPG